MNSEVRGSRKDVFYEDYVVFDLETTGISCKMDQIVEISAVKIRGGVVVDEFSTLVNPGMSIPYYASQVNGITDDMVEDAPQITVALEEFLSFIEDFPLVGHNIHSFDMKFIYRDSENCFGKRPENDYVDTLLLSRQIYPEMHHHKLADMAQLFGIENEQAHRALSDARTNQKVYECLAKEAKQTKALRTCPKCGGILVKRSGRYGMFWGCSTFPNCRYTEDARS